MSMLIVFGVFIADRRRGVAYEAGETEVKATDRQTVIKTVPVNFALRIDQVPLIAVIIAQELNRFHQRLSSASIEDSDLGKLLKTFGDLAADLTFDDGPHAVATIERK